MLSAYRGAGEEQGGAGGCGCGGGGEVVRSPSRPSFEREEREVHSSLGTRKAKGKRASTPVNEVEGLTFTE